MSSIPTIYIEARSKNDANLKLKADPGMIGMVYEQLNSDARTVAKMPLGTVVKIYREWSMGSPVATSYGNIAKRVSGEIYIK